MIPVFSIKQRFQRGGIDQYHYSSPFCVGICFSQILIVIDGKIVHTAGERPDNGKSAPPTLLSFGIDLFAAINILTVSNHVIDTLADQFSYGCFLFRGYPLQNLCLILCQ